MATVAANIEAATNKLVREISDFMVVLLSLMIGANADLLLGRKRDEFGSRRPDDRRTWCRSRPGG